MKLLICILFTSLLSYAQEANQQFVFINLGIGASNLNEGSFSEGYSLSGQVGISRNHNCFLMHYNYNSQLGRINPDRPPLTVVRDRYNDYLNSISFMYARSISISPVVLRIGAGPSYVTYVNRVLYEDGTYSANILGGPPYYTKHSIKETKNYGPGFNSQVNIQYYPIKYFGIELQYIMNFNKFYNLYGGCLGVIFLIPA